MAINRWRFSLDTKKQTSLPQIVSLRKGDRNADVLELTITTDGTAADLSGYEVHVVGVRPDGKYCSQMCQVDAYEQGKATCTLNSVFAGVEGVFETAYAEIRVGDEMVGSTTHFVIRVFDAGDMEEGEAGDYQTRVDQLEAAYAESLASYQQQLDDMKAQYDELIGYMLLKWVPTFIVQDESDDVPTKPCVKIVAGANPVQIVFEEA